MLHQNYKNQKVFLHECEKRFGPFHNACILSDYIITFEV